MVLGSEESQNQPPSRYWDMTVCRVIFSTYFKVLFSFTNMRSQESKWDIKGFYLTITRTTKSPLFFKQMKFEDNSILKSLLLTLCFYCQVRHECALQHICGTRKVQLVLGCMEGSPTLIQHWPVVKFLKAGEAVNGWNGAERGRMRPRRRSASAAKSWTPSWARQPNTGLHNSATIQMWVQSQDLLTPAAVSSG